MALGSWTRDAVRFLRFLRFLWINSCGNDGWASSTWNGWEKRKRRADKWAGMEESSDGLSSRQLPLERRQLTEIERTESARLIDASQQRKALACRPSFLQQSSCFGLDDFSSVNCVGGRSGLPVWEERVAMMAH